MKTVASQAEFDEVVNAAEGLVVIDFFAQWCGPCKVIGPKLEGWANEMPEVTFIKVDVDEAEEVAEKAGVSAMPTFHFYKKGSKVAEIVGANEAALKAKIEELK